MRVFDKVRQISHTITENIAARRRMARFSCGDCMYNGHCGLPPREDCIERLEQIELYGDHPRRRPPALTQAL